MAEDKKSDQTNLSRRDFLKVAGSGLGVLAIRPGRVEGLVSPETAKAIDKPLFDPGIVTSQFKHATNLGFEANLISKANDQMEIPPLALSEILNGEVLAAISPQLTEKGIDISTKVWASDLASPTWQFYLENPQDNGKMLEALAKNDSDLVIPDALEHLKSKNIKTRQMAVIPPGPAGDYGIVIWNNGTQLKVEKIEAPERSALNSYATSYGPMDIVGEGAIRKIITNQDTAVETRSMLSLGSEMIEIPGSVTVTETIPRTPGPYQEASYETGKKEESFVAEAAGGGVFRFSSENRSRYISLWDVKKGDFGKPIKIEEVVRKVDDKMPVFLFRDTVCVIGMEADNGTREISTRNKRKVILSSYDPETGKKIESAPLVSHAGYEMAVVGSFSPDLERDSKDITQLSGPFGHRVTNTLDITPSVLVKCPGQLSTDGKETGLALIRDMGWGVIKIVENPQLLKEADLPPVPEYPNYDPGRVSA